MLLQRVYSRLCIFALSKCTRFAANAGVPLHIVQSIVGHESTAMTRHYYHENLDALKSAVAAIPTL